MTDSAAAPSAAPAVDEPIVARASSYYRSRRYIMVAVVLAFAGYFAYDGWSAWPQLNEKIADVTKRLNETKDDEQKKVLDTQLRELGAPKSDFDIWLQKVLACTLPFVAIGYASFFLYRSRGQIVLNGDVLTVPGHPPVSIDEIRAIDNRKWKKKGIAHLAYASGGRERTITLDDFIYDQAPVDRIYETIAKRHGIAIDAPATTAATPSAS